MSRVIDRESTQIVSSKYFTPKPVMDESLSDFQEPKKLAGPKSKTKADKPKKALKRIKGQKDIRKVLRSKKNELESYAKDFDHVCKQAGLDVDSEQLQLAIALSKSLQQSESTNESPETSQSSNTKDRVGKIRTTLLEYGFKVPEIKITASTSRRLKRRKKYKLLLTSEEAKKEIISERYCRVLFENITPSQSYVEKVDVSNIQLYHLATNVTYNILKDINTFYVDGLLEKSTGTGILLRDWSQIPGRPSSPKLCEPSNMNFSEIECSQDELDIVLSGSLKSCKNILKTKEISVSKHKIVEKSKLGTDHLDNSLIVLIDDEDTTQTNATLKTKEIEIIDLPKDEYEYSKTNKTETINTENPFFISNQQRSCSPDIFDDEPSTVVDDTKNQCSKEERFPSQKDHKNSENNDVMDLTGHDQNAVVGNYSSNIKLSQNTNVTRKIDDFMELTKCVEVKSLETFSVDKTLLSSVQNITKRKSDDFMEITNCVASPVKPSIQGEVDIDLTQSPENVVSLGTTKYANYDSINKDNVKLLESNQHYKSNDDDPINVDESIADKTSDENNTSGILQKVVNVIQLNDIDLTESPELIKNNNKTLEYEGEKSFDLTQSSNTSDELPFVSLKHSKNKPADDTIIMDPKDYYEDLNISANANNSHEFLDSTQNLIHEEVNYHSIQETQNIEKELYLAREQNNENVLDSTKISHNQIILDLTQETATLSKRISKTSEINKSFFEEFIHNHSDTNNAQENINNEDRSFHKDISEKVSSAVQSCSKESEGVNKIVVQPSNLVSLAEQNLSDDIDLTQNSESSEDLRKKDCSDIDLTQNSESEELTQGSKDNGVNVENEEDSDATFQMKNIKSSQRCSSLGKKDNVSIDYDEVFDDLINKHHNSRQNVSRTATDLNLSNVSNKSKDLSNHSQLSEVFVISDDELDYSMYHSKLERPVDNFLFGGISIMDELSGLSSLRKSDNVENNSDKATKNEKINGIIELENYNEHGCINKTPIKHKRLDELATPQKPSCSEMQTVVTPSKNEYVIKTNNVTPMPKFESMSLPELHSELDKFGVKPFKRKRAIQLLTHIYNQTHPIVEPYSDEESPCKRRKIENFDSPTKDFARKLKPRKILSPKKNIRSPRKVSEGENSPNKVSKNKGNAKNYTMESNERLNYVEALQLSNNNVVNEVSVIKEVHCNPEDWVFQKREKAKVHSCRVPLHIAFYNYVSSRPRLREAILCYEPINIDDIHKDLVAFGHRYDPKDLLKFMDKKCITVKTTDNDARNNKR